MVLKIILLRLVAVMFLLQTVAKCNFQRSNNSNLVAIGKSYITMTSNRQKRNVGLSQRNEKSSGITKISSSITPSNKDNMKKYGIIGGSEKFLSLVLRKRNHKNKSRTKRNLSEGNQSAVTDTISPVSVKSSSIAATVTTGTTMITTQSPLDPTKDINVTCVMDNHSCKNRCAKKRDPVKTNHSHLFCYCDNYCETFTDCCYDYNRHCKNESGYSYPNSSWLLGWRMSNISNNDSTSNNYFKCVSPKEKGLSATDGIWMIADCPDNFHNTTTHKKCIEDYSLSYKNYKNSIPVLTRNGKTYKNRFCSLCHGVSDDELSYYALSYSCRILPPRSYNKADTLTFLSSYCSVSWKPNSGHQRRYCYIDTNKCSREAATIIRKGCHNGLSGIVSSRDQEGKILGYQHVYCTLCYIDTSVKCRLQNGFSPTGIRPRLPFSVIMDLGFLGRSHSSSIPHQTHVFCPTGKVYDPHFELCRTGIASGPQQARFDKYRIFVWIENTTKPSRRFMAAPNEQLIFLQDFVAVLIDLLVSNIKITTDDKTYRIMFDFVRKVEKTSNERRLATTLTADDLLEFSQPKNILISSTNFTIIKVTSRRLTCVVVERFLPHEYTITAHPELEAYIHKTKEVINRQDYYLNESKNGSDGTITVCRKHFHFSCITGSIINLSANEITEFPNKSILWNVGMRVYAKGNYEKQNGTVWICSHFSLNGTKRALVEKVVEHPLMIVTTVGLSLSVCSLSALLITYSVICELRTHPGISLMNLSFSVLASHLLWLLGSRLTSKTTLCTAVSLALHFFFLSSFVWMSIIAIDTWCAFTKTGQPSNCLTHREKRRRYLRSMAIGWVSPLIFCLFCFTLDATNTVAIGYGGTKGCWIQNSSSNLYFFATPMGLLLFFNAVFFVLTVKSIRETMKNSQMATSRIRSKNDLGIFVRIAALLGFTWVFGFLSSLHLYLSYVFVVSCTLQGVYIAAAFLFTKRNLRLYSVLLSKVRSSPSTKASSSSHQKGQPEHPLCIGSSVNNTSSKKNSFKAKTELHSIEVVTNNGTESTNTYDTRL